MEFEDCMVESQNGIITELGYSYRVGKYDLNG